MKITVHYASVPSFVSGHAYTAYDDSTYGGPGSTVGHGGSPREAIADFMEQWEADHDEPVLPDGERPTCPLCNGDGCEDCATTGRVLSLADRLYMEGL